MTLKCLKGPLLVPYYQQCLSISTFASLLYLLSRTVMLTLNSNFVRPIKRMMAPSPTSELEMPSLHLRAYASIPLWRTTLGKLWGLIYALLKAFLQRAVLARTLIPIFFVSSLTIYGITGQSSVMFYLIDGFSFSFTGLLLCKYFFLNYWRNPSSHDID